MKLQVLAVTCCAIGVFAAPSWTLKDDSIDKYFKAEDMNVYYCQSGWESIHENDKKYDLVMGKERVKRDHGRDHPEDDKKHEHGKCDDHGDDSKCNTKRDHGRDHPEDDKKHKHNKCDYHGDDSKCKSKRSHGKDDGPKHDKNDDKGKHGKKHDKNDDKGHDGK